MREFHPPVVSKGARTAIGIVFLLVVLAPLAGLSLVLAGAGTHAAARPPGPSPSVVLVVMLVPVVIVSVLAAVVMLGPGRMRYVVGGGFLEVRTMFGTQRWPAAGARAKVYTPGRLWRVMGTSVPGYHTGRYRESGLATRVYATTLDRAVLFEGEDRVLVSPEDQGEMLRALEQEGVQIERH